MNYGRGIEAGLPTIAPMLSYEPPEWTFDALCAQMPIELFYVGKGGSTREAKTICSWCPSRAECLAMAMTVETVDYCRFGVFGGMSPKERVALSDAGWKPGDLLPEIRIDGRGRPAA